MASSVARMPAGDLCSPAISAHRRQSQILDRWAARQAREMISTIERQRHESELSALSNVRASSLIQMWREMEADADASPRCGAASPPAAEEASGGSDAERRGVGKMVRMMSLKISSWASSSSGGSELLAVAKERVENGPIPATLPAGGGGGKVVRVRGRKEIEGLVMRMKQERLREIAELAEKRKVSRFPFRGRIQPLIRLRSLRQEVATIKHQQRSINLEVEELQKVSNSIFLRKIAEDMSQHNVNGTKIEKHTTDSQDSDFGKFVDHFEIEDTQYTELEFVWRSCVPSSRLETEKKSHLGDDNVAQQRPEIEKFGFHGTEFDSRFSTSLQRPETTGRGEVTPNGTFLSTIELENSPQTFHQGEILMEDRKDFADCNCLSQQNFADNAEIRELLERRTVSNIIASDFSHKMNQLMNSFIQKQALQNDNENGEEETIWRQNNEDCSDQDLSASFNQNSSSSERDEDILNGLRDGFTLMQSELSELRKLVESCLEWQQKMECGIKQQFSSAVDKLVGRGKSSVNNTKWNGACCICCEAQVDTVLYRCGHMCACFKCSQGLQWSSGNCPICCSTIIDIVRVYIQTSKN